MRDFFSIHFSQTHPQQQLIRRSAVVLSSRAGSRGFGVRSLRCGLRRFGQISGGVVDDGRGGRRRIPSGCLTSVPRQNEIGRFRNRIPIKSRGAARFPIRCVIQVRAQARANGTVKRMLGRVDYDPHMTAPNNQVTRLWLCDPDKTANSNIKVNGAGIRIRIACANVNVVSPYPLVLSGNEVKIFFAAIAAVPGPER
jgi:hypothetical protein